MHTPALARPEVSRARKSELRSGLLPGRDRFVFSDVPSRLGTQPSSSALTDWGSGTSEREYG